jgi:hypothetical protein
MPNEKLSPLFAERIREARARMASGKTPEFNPHLSHHAMHYLDEATIAAREERPTCRATFDVHTCTRPEGHRHDKHVTVTEKAGILAEWLT